MNDPESPKENTAVRLWRFCKRRAKDAVFLFVFVLAAVAGAIGGSYFLGGNAPGGYSANRLPVFERPAEHCGDCGALCRAEAFDQILKVPNSVIDCALIDDGVALVMVRTAAGADLWVSSGGVIAPGSRALYDGLGRDWRPIFSLEAQQRWPWFFDGIPQPDFDAPQQSLPLPQGVPQGAPAPLPVPAPDAYTLPPEMTGAIRPQPPAAPAPALSRWVLIATPESIDSEFAADVATQADLRRASEEELESVLVWIDTIWGPPEDWTRMAWIDPQCPQCRRLHEENVPIDHFAPRIILPDRSEDAWRASGWLMADPPDLARFLAFEKAPEDLSMQAAEAQQDLELRLRMLRPDWSEYPSVPLQAMRGEGWLLFWRGANDPPGFLPPNDTSPASG